MNKPVPGAVANTPGQRAIEDMSPRGFSVKTQRSYVRIVSRFAAFLSRSPDTATAEDQLHQSEFGMNAPAFNGTVAALRFFFTIMLDRPDLSGKLIRFAYPRNLPTVLSPEEVGRPLGASTCINEIGDIDSTRPLTGSTAARAAAVGT